ncbi:MAG: NUDIX domain-containing protein [Acidimicrobiales bacterium]
MNQPDSPFVRPRVAAGVLFLDEDDRILMVIPSYKDFLDIPGGYVEAGESPGEAARREVREELGIEPPVGRLLVADWRHDDTDGHDGAKLLFVFDGGHLPPSQRDVIAVDGAEVTGYKFHAVDDLAAVTIPRLANRLEHAVAARQDGSTRYLEDGQPVTK